MYHACLARDSFRSSTVFAAYAHGIGSNRPGAGSEVHPQGRAKHEKGATVLTRRVVNGVNFTRKGAISGRVGGRGVTVCVPCR